MTTLTIIEELQSMKQDKDIQFWAKVYNDSFVNEQLDEDTASDRAALMAAIAAKNKADFEQIQQDEIARKNARSISSIWVKSMTIDVNNENNSVADLEITYSDGTVDEVQMQIGTTGAEGRYIDRD